MAEGREDLEEDIWSSWLLRLRHADDPEYEPEVRAEIVRFADRVIDAAHLAPGMTVIDVGTGDGLVGLRAITHVGSTLKVIFTDISAVLLRETRVTATDMGVAGQCTFLQGSAEQLAGIPDASVDVVVTRASLAYVADKGAALREFHRVLKPGGRISIAEPALQEEAFKARILRQRVEASRGPQQDRFLTLLHRWHAAQFPDTEEEQARTPHVNYGERDLITWARAAGFQHIHMQLEIDILPTVNRSWSRFIGTSPHPLAPTLGQIMVDRFSAEERELFEGRMRPQIERGATESTHRIIYLTARKAGIS